MVDFKEYAVKWTDSGDDWYFVASKIKPLSDNFDAITDYMNEDDATFKRACKKLKDAGIKVVSTKYDDFDVSSLEVVAEYESQSKCLN